MLDGIDSNRIIVGAYTDRQGGVCPMLAAHRNGGRTSLASFARAWDRYTRAGKGPRPATERELLTLRTMLEASIAIDSGVDEELRDDGGRATRRRKVSTPQRDDPPPTGETRPHRGAARPARLGLDAAVPPLRRLRDRARAAARGEQASAERENELV